VPLKQRALRFGRCISECHAIWKDLRMTTLLPFWHPLLHPTWYNFVSAQPIGCGGVSEAETPRPAIGIPFVDGVYHPGAA
jgi:hypothetical protein